MKLGLVGRLMIPFLLFMGAGTAALVLLLLAWGQRNFERTLQAQAESNAAFFANSNLPRSGQIATYLGRVLDAEVEFRHPYREYPAAAARRFAATAAIDASTQITLTADRPSATAILSAPLPLLALGAFWLAALVAAYVVARGVVRPILALRNAVSEAEPRLPGEDRRDEIGDLARTLRETREARAEAEKSMALAALGTGFAHEIKNPLAAARMHLELLADETDAGHGSVAVVQRQLERVESLVQQWQFLMRPEPPVTKRQAIAPIAEATVERLRPAADHAEVEIVNEIDRDLEAEVDRARLAQVFDNLVLNAIQAMPGGGAVTLRSEGGRVVVTDTGPGFSEEALEALSAPERMFYSSKEGGMGIGFRVCQQIMRSHGGGLEFGNRDEGGAEVVMSFAAARPGGTAPAR